jgi:hypothetical protein
MPVNHSSKYSELTDEQFSLIGKLMIEFSNIDFLLGILLSRLLFTPEFLGRTYSDQMMASKKIDGIENALDIHINRYGYKIIPKRTVEKSTELIREIKGIKNLRNKFAHYCWSRWNDNEIFGSKISGSLPNEKKPNKEDISITNAELISHYKKAYSIVERIEEIINQIPEFEENIELIKKTLK